MYASAQPSRLTAGWGTSTASADTEIRSSLTNLRARSRTLIRDAAYAKRANVVVVNNVIGGGMGLQAQVHSSRNKLHARVNEAIETAWKRWNRAEFCHTGGTLHFSDMERALMGQVFDAGEVFIREHKVPFGNSDIPYCLELIESERVPHGIEPHAVGGANEVRMGIEVDPYYRPLAYWIRDRHPSDFHYPAGQGSERIRRVPADEIIHLRLVERWPQTRGVPWLHAVARKLNDMDGYSEAEIIAARGAANYLASEEGSDPFDPNYEKQEDGTFETELEPGIILRPPAGRKMSFFAPNRPNSALDPFMRYMLREVAAGTGVSYESLSRDYSQSNYSSSRLALLDDRDLWKVLQMWFIRMFRERVHRNWLQQAVLANAVQGVSRSEFLMNRDKFEAVKYKPRGWSWVDPTKEVSAYKEAEKAGYITKTQIIAQTGGGVDFEDVMEERRQELDTAAEKNLQFDTDPGADKPAPVAAKAEPEPEDEEEEEESVQMRLIK
jgi:lambda family phage portal protein